MIFVALIGQVIEFLFWIFSMIIALIVCPFVTGCEFFNQKRGWRRTAWIVGPLAAIILVIAMAISSESARQARENSEWKKSRDEFFAPINRDIEEVESYGPMKLPSDPNQ
jgi:hypothetical protein